MESKKKIKFDINFLLALILPFIIGALIMLLLGYNPIEAYTELFKGAFIGKFNIGTTLAKFCPIFLTAVAYCISSKVGYVNMGIEGCFYLGALMAAGVGFLVTGVAWYIHIPLCFLAGGLAGMIWAWIPGYMRAYWNVNELCSALLLNYVAINFTMYMIAGPWSSKGASSQTVPILESAELSRLLKPSRLNSGIFIAIVIFLLLFWLLKYTKFGYRLRFVGTNPLFSDYIGVESKRMVVYATMLSGFVGGIAGSIQTMGVFGTIIDGFSNYTAFDGMLASLIAGNNMASLPIYSFMIAALKNGALGMERWTGVPKALIDTLIPILILFINMRGFFAIKKWMKKKKTQQ